MHHRIRCVSYFVPFLTAMACLLPSGCSSPKPHSGDGSYRDLSGFIGPTYVPGYDIRMPDFDLAHAQEAVYEISDLQNLGQECGVYLAIDAGSSSELGVKDTKKVDGLFELELQDSHGVIVMAVSGRLGDYIWAQGAGFQLYQLDRSFFSPDPGEAYKLRVSYMPDEQLAGLRGFVLLRNGGSK